MCRFELIEHGSRQQSVCGPGAIWNERQQSEMGKKRRRIDRATARDKVTEPDADAIRAGYFLKCSESGYILDLAAQSSARRLVRGQRVADKAKCRSTALGGNL